MFENFVFGTQAQTANARTFDDDISPSPTDCSFPPASLQPLRPNGFLTGPPHRVMNDIVYKLSQQSLHPDEHELPRQSVWKNGSLPSLEFDDDPMSDFTKEELSYTSTTRGTVTLLHHSTHSLPSLPLVSHPPRGSVACRRLQRQLNVQLQICSGHMKDISALVEDMVANQSQCRLHRSTPSRSNLSSPVEGLEDDFSIADLPNRPISPDEDEGFAEMEDDDDHLLLDGAVTLRRASTPSGIRKYHVVGWRKSADCVSAVDAQGRMKVRNVPRMRRRGPKNGHSDVRP